MIKDKVTPTYKVWTSKLNYFWYININILVKVQNKGLLLFIVPPVAIKQELQHLHAFVLLVLIRNKTLISVPPPPCDPPLPPPLDVLLPVGSRRGASQQHRSGGFLHTLHSPSLQSLVPGLRPAGVHLQRLLNVDGVQVEEHQRTHIPGGQSRPGGKPFTPQSHRCDAGLCRFNTAVH